MSAKYKKIPAFSAKIVYSMVNESEGINENFEGDITIKGNKYRLVMEGQEIINNGETVWTYLPDDNEVSIDNHDPDNGDIDPTKIYTAYESGFKYLYVEDVQKKGKTYQVVDLVPEDSKANNFFKIKLEIGQADRTLNSWTMFDKSGDRYTYHVTEFNDKSNPGDDVFVFDVKKYKGIDVIDLR